MLTGSRAVVFVAGAGLVAVWFAAAADRQPNIAASETQRRERDGLVRAERLADEIQSQASRLRTRLAGAPQPTLTGRNPFMFQARPRTLGQDRVHAAPIDSGLETALAATPPEPPPIALSGVAEDSTGAGNSATTVRIAVLEGYGDVFLARVGETIASRYQVTAIGADTAELKDLLTGRTIRLGLR
jgi:hypothetical protein